MTKRITAIPTSYKGIIFRSKLEASWARFFDNITMRWTYEVEGYEFADGTRYLPDFWLPDCKTFFEVKGVFDEKSWNKIRQLSNAASPKEILVAIGESDVPFSLGLISGSTIYRFSDTDIAVCSKCLKPYILCLGEEWTCRNCGYYDGDATFRTLILDDMRLRVV